MALLGEGVEFVEAIGQVTDYEATLLNADVNGARTGAAMLQSLANQAMGDLMAAIFTFVGFGQANLPPLPTSVAIVSFQMPPPSIPSSVGEVTAIGTISGGLNTPVTVSVTGTDGFTDSITQDITGTGSVTLTIPAGEPGVVDTFTLDVQGLPALVRAVNYT